MQPAHTVHFLTSVASESRHTEAFIRVTRIDTTQIHQILPTDAHPLRITTHVFTEQTFIKVIVSSRNRSMYSVKRRSTNHFQCFIECHAAFYEITQTLYVAQSSMSFVTVVYVFLDTQLLQQQHTADTQQNFLFQTIFPVTTIQLVSDRTVELTVHFIICIQQIQRYTTYIDSPYVCMYVIVQIRYVQYHRLVVFIFHTFQRQAAEVLCLVVGNLLSIH